jgi:HSP20 family protein
MATQLVRGSLFDDFFRDFQGLTPGYFIKPLQGGETLPAPGQIRIDVKESDDAYTVHAELPGVSKNEINVSIDGNVVTLRAEVRQESEVKEDEKVLRAERFYGAVARSFQLPQDIDQAKAKAKYDQGVLTLTLPKKQTHGSQRLMVE